MQKLAAFILALSLYAPGITSLFTYTECVLQVNTNNQACDCKLTNVPVNSENSSIPGNQKEITEQVNLKYIAAEAASYKPVFKIAVITSYDSYKDFILSSFTNTVFHPPCC